MPTLTHQLSKPINFQVNLIYTTIIKVIQLQNNKPQIISIVQLHKTYKQIKGKQQPHLQKQITNMNFITSFNQNIRLRIARFWNDRFHSRNLSLRINGKKLNLITNLVWPRQITKWVMKKTSWMIRNMEKFHTLMLESIERNKI